VGFGPVLNREHPRAQRHHGGDVHRRGEDRHVRGGAAAADRQAGDAPRIELHQLRRQQVVGDDDGAVRQGVRRGGLAGKLQQHLAAQVGKVGRALHHPRVARCAQLVDVPADGAAPASPGAGASGDRRAGCRRQLGVGQEGQVRLNDLTALGGFAALARAQRRLDRGERAGERGGFGIRRAGGLDDDHLGLDQPHRRADGEAGRGRHAAERAQRGGGRRRGLERFGEGRDRRGGALPVRHHRGQGDQRLGRIDPARDHLDLVAQPHRQRHHRDRTAGVGAATGDLQGDLGGELAGLVGDQRRRTGVQPVRQADPHQPAQRLARTRRRRIAGRGDQRAQGQDRIAQPHLTAADRVLDGEVLTVDHHDRRHQAGGVADQYFQVEGQQQRAERHRLADRDLGDEALAAALHRLQTDVQQDFGAVGGAHRHRVQVVVQADHHAVAGRAQLAQGGIDGEAVAKHLLGEHRIGRLGQRQRPASERSGEDELAGHGAGFLTAGSSSTEPITHIGSSRRRVKLRQRSCLPGAAGSLAESTVTPSPRFAGASGSTAIGAPTQPSARTTSSPAAVVGAASLIFAASAPSWKLNGRLVTAMRTSAAALRSASG
jgi:hypothetical protein